MPDALLKDYFLLAKRSVPLRFCILVLRTVFILLSSIIAESLQFLIALSHLHNFVRLNKDNLGVVKLIKSRNVPLKSPDVLCVNK